MPVRLEIMPNTGHHFFTYPLGDLLTGVDANQHITIVSTWNTANPNFVNWSEHYRWLRFRLGFEGNKASITIAVESNLGDDLRGTLFQVETSEQEPVLAPSVPPYVLPHFEDPELDHEESITRLNLNNRPYPVDLKITFKGKFGTPVDVDLIVDLGNTRTAAVLLEKPNPDKPEKFSERLQVLKIGPSGYEFRLPSSSPLPLPWLKEPQRDLAIIDSWFLLRETLFSHLEPGQILSTGKSGANSAMVMKKAHQHVFPETGRKAWVIQSLFSHNFVDLSPAVIGGGKSPVGAVSLFSQAKLDEDYPFFLSSPKRYAWDRERRGIGGVPNSSAWFQLTKPKGLIQESKPFVPMAGLVRYFMATGGVDLFTHEKDGKKTLAKPTEAEINYFKSLVPNASAGYSHSDGICWFALSLIEAAYRQINSQAYRDAKSGAILPRRLRHIRVTYPTGWTFQERECYLHQWERAINLFTMTRFSDWRSVTLGGNRPELCRDNLDEAVSCQMPILYAEIQALANRAKTWIDLYGRAGEVVVMNLDIGGGTTDLAVIKYKISAELNDSMDETAKDLLTEQLRPELLFRDGYSRAGDMVVKKIIERVLIPAWFEASCKLNPVLRQAGSILMDLFDHPSDSELAGIGGIATGASRRLARALRLIFIPMANQLLGSQLLNKSGKLQLQPIKIRDYEHNNIIDRTALRDLNVLCTFIINQHLPNLGLTENMMAFSNSDDAVLTWQGEEVNKAIDEVFKPFFGALAGLVSQYSCDLLIVSGKPSELPQVGRLLEEAFPLLPQRILKAKGYPVGDWYPNAFSEVIRSNNQENIETERRISDAKTCTVVGAAFFQDMRFNRAISGFTVNVEPQSFEKQAYWGIIPKGGSSSQFFDPNYLLFQPGDYEDAEKNPGPPESLTKVGVAIVLDLALSDNRIGRQLVHDVNVQPSPVYKVAWRPVAQKPAQALAEVTFLWRSTNGEGDALEIASVRALQSGIKIEKSDVHLDLNTLAEESGEFWLDKPKLNVNLLASSPPSNPQTR